MEKNKFSIAIKNGVIAGLIYVLLLTLLYIFGYHSPLMFALYKLIIYLIILGIFFWAGYERKKQIGGYGDFKTIFQTILVCIVVTELIYAVYNYVYLNYVEPQFMDKFKQATLDYLSNKGLTQEQIDQQMEKMNSRTGEPNLKNTLIGIGIWIVVDSIFGLIFASILKKEKPMFQEPLSAEQQ
ncbi:MAG: DUF4199 domain-containing protein [Sphingobacteriales bacterium]|nr:MAG: DUF4199 domain-containing protein [Sphingobacteriales bacterium]